MYVFTALGKVGTVLCKGNHTRYNTCYIWVHIRSICNKGISVKVKSGNSSMYNYPGCTFCEKHESTRERLVNTRGSIPVVGCKLSWCLSCTGTPCLSPAWGANSSMSCLLPGGIHCPFCRDRSIELTWEIVLWFFGRRVHVPLFSVCALQKYRTPCLVRLVARYSSETGARH